MSYEMEAFIDNGIWRCSGFKAVGIPEGLVV